MNNPPNPPNNQGKQLARKAMPWWKSSSSFRLPPPLLVIVGGLMAGAVIAIVYFGSQSSGVSNVAQPHAVVTPFVAKTPAGDQECRYSAAALGGGSVPVAPPNIGQSVQQGSNTCASIPGRYSGTPAPSPSPGPSISSGGGPANDNTAQILAAIKSQSGPVVGAISGALPGGAATPAAGPAITIVYDRGKSLGSAAVALPTSLSGGVAQAAAMRDRILRAEAKYAPTTLAVAAPSVAAATVGNTMQMPVVAETPAPLELPAGTFVPVELDTDVDSDLPGPVEAHSTKDMCDPVTHGVVIPRMAIYLGSTVAQSGERHQGITWFRVTYPDLHARLLSSTATVDAGGHSGIAGRRNIHGWEVFRDTLFGSIATNAGRIIQSALSPRSAGATYSVGGTSGETTGNVVPSAPPVSFTIQHGLRFSIMLLRDYVAARPYHGRLCPGYSR